MRLPTFASFADGLRATVARFPIPTLFAALVTGLLVCSVQMGFGDDSLCLRYAFLAGLGFLFSLFCDLCAEARGMPDRGRLTGQAGILAVLIIYDLFVMPEILEGSRPPFWYSYFILLFVLHLAIALVPNLSKSGSEGVWPFNVSCFLRFFFSSVNAALLFAGLALALLSIDKLFELGIDETFYPQLWFICAFFAHPMLCLSGIPNPKKLSPNDDFPKPLRFTLGFIGLPLVALYLVILYAYLAKIALQWSWPNGWVAMPIFILAVVSLLTFVLSLPLAERENWARFFHRWLFRLLLPLSIVLFLALQVRLGDYGMTINRYLGLALAIWLFGLSLGHILRPGLKVGWMPFSLLLVCLVSVYGGPLGAFGWSQRAQIERIHHLALALEIDANKVLVPSRSRQEPETVRQFESALRYVLENFGPDALEEELSAFYISRKDRKLHSERGYYLTNRVMEYLELEDDLQTHDRYFYYHDGVLPTQGLHWKIDYNFYTGRRKAERHYEIDGVDLNFTVHPKSNLLAIEANGKVVTEIDISQWAQAVQEAIDTNGQKQERPLVFNAETEVWRFSFVLTNAQLRSDETSFQSANMAIFLSKQD